MQAFVFPGQGSQSKGMGGELFDTVAEYRAIEAEVDAVLGYSMRDLCLNDPLEQLNLTQYTQPALYTVNALYFYKTRAEQGAAAYLAGHSLGEYNALLAAGAFDFVTGLKLVQKRGALMGQARDGGMAAIIGLDASDIPQLLARNGLSGIDVANFNSPAQTVISGPVNELEKAQPLFKEAGAKLYKILPVSAAFHSRYMQPAANEFKAFLSGVTFKPLQASVIANVTAKPYAKDDADQIKESLVKQISGSILWTQSVQYLKGAGVDNFIEVGPGSVLTKLIKQII